MPPPARWEEYQAVGSMIPGTKFIAFKVPLKEELCRSLPENERFSPEQLIRTIEESGKRLGLVVDLTFTRKYYNGQYFVKRGIQYEKIFTQGHDVPSDDVVQRFMKAVDDFNTNNTDEDVIIGVHCTHGINRTGYLVCRYMIDCLKMDPDEAIALFKDARGYPIERENYLGDLKVRPLSSDNLASPCQNSDTGSNQHDSARSPEVGQEECNKQALPCNRSQAPPRNRRGKGHGRGRRPSRDFPNKDKRGESSASYRRGASDRGLQREVYSSPLEHSEDSAQGGWGYAARSGWGSSQGRHSRTQDFSRDKNGGNSESRRHYHHDRQNYSWRRSDETQSHAGSDWRQAHRDRSDDIRREHNQKDFKSDSRADMGRHWHQRNVDNNSSHQWSGRGRRLTGNQGNPSNNTQDRPSGGFRGRGNRGGQMTGEMGARLSAGWNGGTGGWNGGMAGWNSGTAGWNGGMTGWNGGMAGWNGGSAERTGWNS